MISSASRMLRHIGFSTSTWMSCARAAQTASAWYSSLLSTRTASIPPAAIISAASEYRCGTPYWSPTTDRSVGEMSQTARISNSSGSDWRTGRWMTCATSPRPMMPTRSLVTMCLSGSEVPTQVHGAARSGRGSSGKEPAEPARRTCGAARGSSVGGERGVEGRRGGLDLGEAADEPERVGCPDAAVHAGVLPLDADRAGVADGVEHAEDRFPRNVAVAGGDEVPAAPRIGPRQVRRQPAVTPVELLDRFLAVHVVDPVLEIPEESDRVEVLPDEMARVEIES